METTYEQILVNPSSSIKDALKIIDKGGMKIALVTNSEGKLFGTVTDGDIRRGILRGLDLSEPVKKVMNSDPIFIREGADEKEALDLMQEKTVEQIPILDKDDKLTGIYLLRDLVKESQEPKTKAPVVILAGGLGSRLRPLTEEVPKPLLKVGDKPILEIIVERLASHGFNNIYLSVCYEAEQIKEHFNNGKRFGVHINYLEEDDFTGTAGPLRLLKLSDDVPIVVVNGDLLTKVDFKSLLDFHIENKSEMTVGVTKYEFEIPYGVVKVNNQQVVALEEKPALDFFVNAGVYVLESEVLNMIPKKKEFDMTDLVQLLLKKERPVICFPIHEYWLDIGREDDYKRAKSDYKKFFGKLGNE